MPDLTDDLRVIGLFRVDQGEPTGEPPRTWIQVMITGKFKHPRSGEFEITADDLAGYAADITERADRISIDFDHGDTSVGSRAAGWYTGQTEIKPDAQGREALFAEIQLTPAGADAIRNHEYRFISPEFSKTFRDAAGKLIRQPKLWATALTNRPFLPDMQPVTLSELSAHDLIRANQTIPLAMRETLAEKLGLDSDLDVIRLAEWSTAFINDLPDSCFLHVEAGGKKDADGKTMPRSLRHFPVKDASGKVDMPHLRNALARIPQSNLPAAVKKRATAMAERMMKTMGGGAASTQGDTMNPEILKLLGLPEDADETTILAAIKDRDEKAVKAAELETENAALKAAAEKTGETELQKLQAELASERTKRIAGEREGLLSQAVREGRISPAQKAVFGKAFGGDTPTDEHVVALRELIDASPAETIPLRERGSGHDRETDDDAEVAKARKAHSTRDEKTGRGLEPDDESLSLHVKATKHLTEAGKTGWTESEYLAAVQAVRAAV